MSALDSCNQFRWGHWPFLVRIEQLGTRMGQVILRDLTISDIRLLRLLDEPCVITDAAHRWWAIPFHCASSCIHYRRSRGCSGTTQPCLSAV